MKLIVEDDKIIVFLNNLNLKSSINSQIKDIIKMIQKKYNIQNSFYDIFVYNDNNYGSILEINIADSYFEQIDITIIKNVFLYQVDFFCLKDATYYKYNNKLYLKLNKKINEILLGKLIECSQIIYGDEAKKILKLGEFINYKQDYLINL